MISQSVKKSLNQSIINYLSKEIENNSNNEDFVEGLEVAKQCLQTAYSLDDSSTNNAPELTKIFEQGTKNSKVSNSGSNINEELAENLKIQGNHCMKNDQYEEAVKCYSEAIKANPKNSVYLCNRAAAYTKMNRHVDSIVDCWRALDISPDYGKAYGRMGLAYSNLNDHEKAVESYKKALELDPESESVQLNLKVAQDRLTQARNRPSMPNLGGGLPDNISMNAVYNVAEQLMSDRNLQNVFTDVVSNVLSNPPNVNEDGTVSGIPDGTDSGTANPSAAQNNDGTAGSNAAPGGANSVFNLGQQLLSNFQQNNPQVFENLMRTLNNRRQPGEGDDSQQNDGNANEGDNNRDPGYFS